MGKDGHGNDELAKEASADSVGLLCRPGVFVRGSSGKPTQKISAFISKIEGQTPREALAAAKKDQDQDHVKARRDIERYLAKGYLVLEERLVCAPPAKKLRLTLRVGGAE